MCFNAVNLFSGVSPCETLHTFSLFGEVDSWPWSVLLLVFWVKQKAILANIVSMQPMV